jgi:hypothetical protein
MRRLSTTRILVSKAELKHHSVDKVIITLYIYNRQAKYYKQKMLKLFNKIMSISLIKKLKLINKIGMNFIFKIKHDKHILLKTLN